VGSGIGIPVCILAPHPRIVHGRLIYGVIGSIRRLTILFVVDDNGILCQSSVCGQSRIKDHRPTLTVSTTNMTAAANRAVYGGALTHIMAGNHGQPNGGLVQSPRRMFTGLVSSIVIGLGMTYRGRCFRRQRVEERPSGDIFEQGFPWRRRSA
jgi:hypothetical protein